MAVNSTLIKTVFNFLKSEKAKETKIKEIRQKLHAAAMIDLQELTTW